MRQRVQILTILAFTLAGLGSAETAKVKSDEGKPKAESFTTYEDFIEATVDWRILRMGRLEVTGPKLAAMEISLLQKQIDGISKQLSAITTKADSFQQLMITQLLELSALKRESAVLDPAVPNSYQRVETSAGSLLVSLVKVEEYLDGYKVELAIGNPLSVTFQGFSVSANWGSRFKAGDDYDKWSKTLKSREMSFTDNLLSSRWNHVVLIFPETRADKFGYLKVSISVDTVVMTKSQ